MKAWLFLAVCVCPAVARAEDAAVPVRWQAALSASTSGYINGLEFSNKPQFGAALTGSRANLQFGGNIRTVSSGLGTDSEDQVYVNYTQKLKPVSLRYQVTYKAYPGTRDGFFDEGVVYQVTASKPVAGVNVSLGAEYSDTDYATTRKSYGMSFSLGRGLWPKASGWLSVSHKHQVGSVDFTNTNIGIYYQATPKIGVSTSINNWHAYADWAHDRPTLSISLSRKL